jgi:hypothetical protein
MKIHHYIIIGLLIINIFLEQCCGPDFSGRGEGRDTVLIKTERIYDSTKHWFPVFQPAAVDSFIKEVPSNVDTAAILRLFFTEKDYQDQFRDSNIVIDYKAKVYMNALKDFVPSYRILRAKEERKYILEEHKVKVFGGPEIGVDRSGRFYAGPQLMLMNKKENLYTVDFDLINHGVMIGVLWKVRLRNKQN